MNNHDQHASDPGSDSNDGEVGSTVAERHDTRFAFCPHEDLNLPDSYDEVRERFNSLHHNTDVEVLN